MSDDISFDVENTEFLKNIVAKATITKLYGRRPSKFIKTDLKASMKGVSSPTLLWFNSNIESAITPEAATYYEKFIQTINWLKELLKLMVLISSAKSFEKFFELFYNESPKTFQCEHTFIIFYSFTKEFKMVLQSGETVTFYRDQASIIESAIENDEINMVNK